MKAEAWNVEWTLELTSSPAASLVLFKFAHIIVVLSVTRTWNGAASEVHERFISWARFRRLSSTMLAAELFPRTGSRFSCFSPF